MSIGDEKSTTTSRNHRHKARLWIPERKEEFLKLKAPKSELEMSKMPCDVTFSLSNKKKTKDVEKS